MPVKLRIDDIVAADERFETEEALLDRYRDHESEAGRVVPSFILPELLVAVATFIAEYLGARALDRLADGKQQREREAEDARLRTRIEEIERKLDRAIEARQENDEAGDVLPMLSRLGARVVLELETPAERALVPELRRRLPGVEIVVAPV